MGPDPALTPDLVQAQSFTVAFRGYDQTEVRSFLARVSNEVRGLRERVTQLETAWRSAEERAARPPSFDEETLMTAVGEETVAILRTARTAATELRNRATEEAERIQAEAQEVLGRETASAQEAASKIVEAARTEASDLVAKAQETVESIRAQAEQERMLTVEGANATRDKILEDLSRRRRVATVQIEQLRAGRERLIESYAVVRRTLEEAQRELSRADAEARAAADEVGRRLRAEQAQSEPIGSTTEGVTPEGEGAAEEGGRTGGEAARPDEPDGQAPDTGEIPEVVAVTELSAPMEAPASDTDATGDEPGPESPRSEPFVLEPKEFRLRRRIRNGRSRSGGPSVPAAQGRAVTQAGEPPPPPAPRWVGEAGRPVAEPAAGLAVGDLFARIKAEQPDTEKAGEESPGDDPPMAAAAGEGESGERAVPDGDEALLQQREAVVVELEAELTRRLKRALQDEQNDLLDRLRGNRGDVTAARLLPGLDDQVSRYTSAAVSIIEQAVAAGADFAIGILGFKTEGKSDSGSVDSGPVADEAGKSIVEPLRRRLEQSIQSTEGEDQVVMIESIGAAYREWKSQRIERIAGDALAAAFARGTWQVVPDGTTVRWVVEDMDGPCPDCDDDALAGAIPKGEPFPTGQHHPPAHSGCRCLLVPSAPD